MSKYDRSVITPDDAVAGSTQRCSVAGCKPLCPLSNSTSHRWEGGWIEWHWGRVECRAGCSRNGSRDGVGDVGWWWWGRLGKRLYFDVCGGGGFARVKFLGKVLISNPRRPVGRRRWSYGRRRRRWSRFVNHWRSWCYKKNTQELVRHTQTYTYTELYHICAVATWSRWVGCRHNGGSADHFRWRRTYRDLDGAVLHGWWQWWLLHRWRLGVRTTEEQTRNLVTFQFK